MKRMIVFFAAAIIALALVACASAEAPKASLAQESETAVAPPKTEAPPEETKTAESPAVTAAQTDALPPLTETEERIVRKFTVQGAGDFTVTDIDGNVFDSASMRGKIIVLNFWGMWCNPCVEELPVIQEACGQFGDDVVFMAIDSYETPTNEELKDFLSKEGITLPCAHDDDGLLCDAFCVTMFPTTIIIDPEGRVLTIKAGSFRDAGELLTLVDNVRKYYKYVEFDLGI